MDIYSVLKEEHETVKGIFEKLCDTTERAEKGRDELYERLLVELHSHAQAEQEALYTRLEVETENELKHLMAEAEEEHAQAEKMLKELGEMDKTTIEWTAKLTVLKENVEHHIKAEEGDMFKKAKEILKEVEAEAIAETFLALKKDIVASMK